MNSEKLRPKSFYGRLAPIVLILGCAYLVYIIILDVLTGDKIKVYIGEGARGLIEKYLDEIPPSAGDLYIFNREYMIDRFTYIGMTVPLEKFKEYLPRMNSSGISYDDLHPWFPRNWGVYDVIPGPHTFGEKYRTPLWDVEAMEDPITVHGPRTFIYDRKTERLLIIEAVF